MTDAEFEVQKKRIEKLRKWWYGALGLGWWLITYQYVRDGFEVDGERAPNTVASTHADWRYLHATIQWNIRALDSKEIGDEELEGIFVHEVMHIFVNEFRDGSQQSERTERDALAHEERVCTQLAKAFLWTRDKALKEAKA